MLPFARPSFLFVCAEFIASHGAECGCREPRLSSQAAGLRTTRDTCQEVANELPGCWPNHDGLSFQSRGRNRYAARRCHDGGSCH